MLHEDVYCSCVELDGKNMQSKHLLNVTDVLFFSNEQ